MSKVSVQVAGHVRAMHVEQLARICTQHSTIKTTSDERGVAPRGVNPLMSTPSTVSGHPQFDVSQFGKGNGQLGRERGEVGWGGKLEDGRKGKGCCVVVSGVGLTTKLIDTGPG